MFSNQPSLTGFGFTVEQGGDLTASVDFLFYGLPLDAGINALAI